MKTFLEYSEKAKRHARKKFNEAAPVAGQPAAPVAGQPAAPQAGQQQQQQPDYAKFTTAWDQLMKDPNSAAVITAMGKTPLGQLGAELKKLAQQKPAAAPAATATGQTAAPAAGQR
jgi:hypothetical protein